MTRKKAAATKSHAGRELIKNRAGEFNGRRGPKGQFKEMDERGKSLAAERRQKANTTVKPGQGDRGDQKR
jgi:hypothetical protein